MRRLLLSGTNTGMWSSGYIMDLFPLVTIIFAREWGTSYGHTKSDIADSEIALHGTNACARCRTPWLTDSRVQAGYRVPGCETCVPVATIAPVNRITY
jgi:hypothetical protein